MGLLGNETPLSSSLSDGAKLTAGSIPFETAQHRKTILVADDEAVVRTVLKSMLTRLGYDVMLTSDAGEAIKVYASSYSNIDLVLLDLFLPDMTGEMLYEQLRLINPETRAVLVTGNCESELVQDMVATGVNGILGKPFDMAQLSDQITNALAA